MALALQHIGQQQTDFEGLRLELGFARPIQGRLQLADGQQAPPTFQLQQAQQLQGFEVVGVLVEQEAHLPFSTAAVVLITPEFGQHQPQARPLGLLGGQPLQQVGRFLFAVHSDQQLDQLLLFLGGGLALIQVLLQRCQLALEGLLFGVGPAAAALPLAQPPAPRQAGRPQAG